MPASITFAGVLLFLLAGCGVSGSISEPAPTLQPSTTTTTSEYGYYLKCADGTTMFIDGPKSSPRTDCPPKPEPKPIEPWTYPTCRSVSGNTFQCWQDEHGNYRSFN